MKVVDIADQIYREFSYPKDFDIPYIAFWLQNNVGSLNNQIHTNYEYDIYTGDLKDILSTDAVTDIFFVFL